jgi:hypothetical protein
LTDKEYEKARNELIKFAVAYANKKEGTAPREWEGPQHFAQRWNLCYLGEMDRLARKEGLLSQNQPPHTNYHGNPP